MVWLLHIHYYFRFGCFMALRHWKITLGILVSIGFFALLPDCEGTRLTDIHEISANLENAKFQKGFEAYARQGIGKKLPLKGMDEDDLLDKAQTYRGTPYRSGGTDRNGMDCSGLLFCTFRELEISIPHNSAEIGRFGRIIPKIKDLRRGDLIFFSQTGGHRFITHSGIYLGEGRFIHTSTSEGVVVQSLNAHYWQEHFTFGTRLFE